MKNNVKIFIPIVLAILIGSLTFAFAQTNGTKAGKSRPGNDTGAPPPRGGGEGFHPGGLPPHLLAQLNLTDAQKTQISTLEGSARTTSQTYFEALRAADEQLRTIAEGGTFNETQVRQILNQKAQAQIELEFIRLKTDQAIFSLLTAEQRTLLAQLRQQHPEFPPHGGRPGMPPPPQNPNR